MSLKANPLISRYSLIPNGSFSYTPAWQVKAPTGYFQLGNGLTITSDGQMIVASEAGGTVRKVTTGTGLLGGTIEQEGTISLAPPTATEIGGVKAGANVTIDDQGTISVAAPGKGTVIAVNAGPGLTATGTDSVTLSLNAATDQQIGGLILGQTLTAVGATVDVVPATETQTGGVVLASAADVTAGVDNTKAITPAGLASKLATTTSPGLVQLAGPLSQDATKAATAATVFTVGEMANAATVLAGAALPTSGGEMTGPITFAQGQEFPAFAFPIATTTSLGVVQIGKGINVDLNGVISAANTGTVTSLVMGEGIGAPFSGDTITSTGTIRLLPPANGKLGGVKAGDGVAIANDGTISFVGALALNNDVAYNAYQFPGPGPNGGAPGLAGDSLVLVDPSTGELAWQESGGVTQINTGAGLTGGPIKTSGTIALKNTNVIPASYGGTCIIPTFTVDQQGRLTSAGIADPYTAFLKAPNRGNAIVQLDFSGNSFNWEFQLEGTTTLADPLGAKSGQKGSILIRQNPLNPYMLRFDAAWKSAGGKDPVVTQIPSTVDLLEFTVYSPTYIVITNYIKEIS